MNKNDVPQHQAKAFMGRSKALYAVGEDGRYQIVPSNGWEAEEIVLDQAIDEFKRLAADAHARAKAGQVADYLRQHGAFEPHRLGLEDMEYTTMPQLMKKLESRWEPDRE